MNIVKGRNSDLINLFFYKNKNNALLKIERSLQQFFYKKNVYLMVKFYDKSIDLYFYKKKTILEMSDYINLRNNKNTQKFKNFDLAFLSPLYERSNADMRRVIDLSVETLWNGKAITQQTDAILYEVSAVQNDQYYSRIKPNYDKDIDIMLGSDEFKCFISELISKTLNIPYGYDNLNLLERKELIYEKDDQWHINNLYQHYLKSKSEAIIYSNFIDLYQKHDNFYFIREEKEENDFMLNFCFCFKNKNEDNFKVSFKYSKEEIEEKVKFSSSDEMIFKDFKFELTKREIIVKKNVKTKKKDKVLIDDFLEKMS